MRILITGANGQLGKACQARLNGHELYPTDREQLDITDAVAIRRMVERVRPEVIVHAAAMTDVRGAEMNHELAYRLNGRATTDLALVAQAHDAIFVYISTDFVFDGRGHRPYREDDPVSPVNVYGRSKLAGELAVRDLAARHYILRTAWLYGEGKNFVRTILHLAETQSELRVVGDQTGTPTFADDLAGYIAALLAKQAPYGLYHATNDGSATWAELAEEALRLRGLPVPIRPISSEEAAELFRDPVVRPTYSVLSKAKLKRLTTVRPWRVALREYLAKD